MLPRRDFLKKTLFLFTSGIFVPVAGVLRPSEAARWWPMLGGQSERDKYLGWDEATEAGMASDNTFVCFMENTSASGNETGQGGGLTGDDLVLTNSGDVVGATGTPPYRYFVDTDADGMRYNAPANVIGGCSSWTIVMKFHRITDTNGGWLLSFMLDYNTPRMAFDMDSSRRLRLNWPSVGWSTVTSTGIPTDREIWVVAKADGGAHNLTLAWDDEKITDIADLPSGQVSTHASTDGDATGISFTSSDGNWIMRNRYYGSADSDRHAKGYVKYLLISSTSLVADSR